MLARIVDTDFVYKEIAYHAICKTRYQTRADQVKKSKVIQTRKTSIWHRSRSIHWKHLKSICHLIQEEIIERNEVFLTNDLSDQYIAIHSECSGEQDPLTISTTQALEAKIKKHFKEKIQIQKLKTRRGNLVHSNNTTVKEALRKESQQKAKLNSVRDEKHNLLSTDITLDKIMSGEIEIPEEVLQFFKYLRVGADNGKSNSSNKLRTIKSISEDVLYSVTSGRKEPSKDLKLGLVIKNLTGNKKSDRNAQPLWTLSKLYHLEDFKTELAFTSYSESFLTPLEMKRSPSLCTGLAFDNFDPFVETSTGKDTLHDTVCIAYQQQRKENVDEAHQEYENQTVTEQVINTPIKRRRAFLSYDLDIEPYHKK